MTSSIGPLRIVEETHPSRIVEASGIVEIDRVNVQSMIARGYSTVMQVHVDQETLVQKGSVIATLTCPLAMQLQTIYLYRLLGKEMGSGLIFTSEEKHVGLRLQDFGLTERDFRRIRRTRRPLETLDVRTPWSGIIIDLPQPGDEIEQDEAVFSIAWRKVIRVTVPLADAPAIGAPVKFRGNGKVFDAVVDAVKKHDETADVEIGVMDWSEDVPMGVPVRIKFLVRQPPSRHLVMVGMPQLDLSDWRHASVPRGEALRQLLRKHDRHEDAAKFGPPPPRAEMPAAKVAPTTPVRRPLPPPPPLAAEAHDGIRRASIAISEYTRQRFGIQHHHVSQTQFTPQAYFTAHVKVLGSNAAPITLAAPIGGKVTWLSNVTDRALATGEPYCRIEGEQVRAVHDRFLRAIASQRTAEAQRARRALVRLGMTSEDISHLEKGDCPRGVLSLRALAPCRIAEMDVATGQVVAKDAALAQARPLHWTALCLELDEDTRAEFGNVVDVYLPDSDTGHSSMSAIRELSLIDVSRKQGRVQCRIEFPVTPPGLLGSKTVRIFMTAPAKRRSVITVPEDCVTTLCRTREVLIDEGFKVTPQTVQVGRHHDGRIEILRGLSEGHRVVRNLNVLALQSKRLSAILLGLWRPEPLYWESGLDE
ncbi:efflux RND transporter periplasmic adaptor subunit [Sandarakinorhabdus sp.]|uniref:efflux RND transporter periplasmic adaptor subunit n=1 Tax=Sandarakinorhabdus sp. TaxID=1916663 RepID=UPI003F717AF4